MTTNFKMKNLCITCTASALSATCTDRIYRNRGNIDGYKTDGQSVIACPEYGEVGFDFQEILFDRMISPDGESLEYIDIKHKGCFAKVEDIDARKNRQEDNSFCRRLKDDNKKTKSDIASILRFLEEEGGIFSKFSFVDKNPEAKMTKQTSDGSTADYYKLPTGCTELQHLISERDMNAQIGEIFRACYRYGMVEHSQKKRDIKKILFYAAAELERLERLEGDR